MPAERPARVAMIDDNPDDVLLARLFLRRACVALDIERHVTAEAFLAAMEAGAPPPDIALVDLNLPMMKGAGLLRRARGAAWAGATTFGVLSGSTDPADRAEALDAGAAFFLSKPLTRATLDAVCAAAPRFRLGPGADGAEGLLLRSDA